MTIADEGGEKGRGREKMKKEQSILRFRTGKRAKKQGGLVHSLTDKTCLTDTSETPSISLTRDIAGYAKVLLVFLKYAHLSLPPHPPHPSTTSTDFPGLRAGYIFTFQNRKI